jgi:hypothetical protein
LVLVGEAVAVGVLVRVAVGGDNVAVFVRVGVLVGTAVFVRVAVRVGEAVGSGVEVFVGGTLVAVAVLVEVGLDVLVAVEVADLVAVGVVTGVTVFVAVGLTLVVGVLVGAPEVATFIVAFLVTPFSSPVTVTVPALSARNRTALPVSPPLTCTWPLMFTILVSEDAIFTSMPPRGATELRRTVRLK